MISEIFNNYQETKEALESNIMDGDHSSIEDGALQLIEMMDRLVGLFDPEPAPEFFRANSDDLETLKRQCDLTIDGINKAVMDEINNGVDVNGFKIEIKKGKISRKWAGESAVINYLSKHIDKDALVDTKLKGIPAIEKILKQSGLGPAQTSDILEPIIIVTDAKETEVLVKS